MPDIDTAIGGRKVFLIIMKTVKKGVGSSE